MLPTNNILITGGAGFIGSNLVHYLIEHTDFNIVVVDALTYAGNLNSLSALRGEPRLTIEEVDICDAAKVAELFSKYKPRGIMHLAAESHVDRSIDGPGEFVQTNVVGTYNLLQSALGYWREANKPDEFRFLHVSTDEVFGSLRPGDAPFCETTPYDPHSPYSASKAASDHLARAWHTTYGLPVLITNCSNNYGPFQFPEKLIPVVILKCLKGEPIPVYGKGDNIRDWLYVEDHCSAISTVFQRGRIGETYVIGGNNEQKNIDLVRTLCRLMDEFRQSPDCRLMISDSESDPTHQESAVTNQQSHKSYEELITFVSDRPGHDMRYAIDATKIREELGWEPAEKSETGLRKTVLWYLENRDWWENILSGDYQLERLGKGSESENKL